MIDFAHYFFLSVPLFGLVLLGYFIASWRDWRAHWTQYASWLVLSLVIPAMLFHMMSNRGALPAVDARLLIAFFGGCLLVFAIGRFIAESAGIAERSWAPWYPGEKDVWQDEQDEQDERDNKNREKDVLTG
jgi:predicted permease